jgi:hypothetical protein
MTSVLMTGDIKLLNVDDPAAPLGRAHDQGRSMSPPRPSGRAHERAGQAVARSSSALARAGSMCSSNTIRVTQPPRSED